MSSSVEDLHIVTVIRLRLIGRKSEERSSSSSKAILHRASQTT